MLIRWLVCGGMAAARLMELRLSKKNLEGSGPVVQSPLNAATYPLIIAVHALTIGGTFFFGKKPSWPWLALLIGVQPLRAWVLATLGKRWNTLGAVPQEMEIETGGPYAYIRHPNYLVVVIELLALPMAFRMRGLALLALVANGTLVALRVRGEESELMRIPAYARHFRDKKRFIPGVF